jgi:hypothetical protein
MSEVRVQPQHHLITAILSLYVEHVFATLIGMFSSSPADAIRALLPDDISVLDAEHAGATLQTVKACRGFLDAYEARLTRHIGRLHAAGASAPAADLHTRDGGVSSKEARQKERRAEALEHAPSLADSLETGDVTAAHADALADVTARLDDATKAAFFDHHELLAADATRRTPEEFAKNCRDLLRSIERDQGLERDRRQRRDTRLTKHIDRDGMYTINARLHPELGHAIFNAIDAETAKLVKQGGDRTVDRSAVAAEALGNLVTGGHQAIRPREAEIRLHVDERTLTSGPHDHTVCEYDDGTPVPPTSVRRLLCNGHIVPIILGADGTALDIGRTQRLANRAQRRALRAMYPTCAFHGCDVEFNRCEIHHLHAYELGGLTDLDNLLPLCSRHHHVVHDLNWTLDLDRHRTLTIRDAHDRIHAVVPLPSSVRGVTPRPTDHPDERPPGRPPDQLTLIA